MCRILGAYFFWPTLYTAINWIIYKHSTKLVTIMTVVGNQTEHADICPSFCLSVSIYLSIYLSVCLNQVIKRPIKLNNRLKYKTAASKTVKTLIQNVIHQIFTKVAWLDAGIPKSIRSLLQDQHCLLYECFM